ncbi:hypothetical protein chiPu_0032862, partial [Chiloscyllium punctatum]|nr:hypothetical protein [Chiloscyllium punctatum]
MATNHHCGAPRCVIPQIRRYSKDACGVGRNHVFSCGQAMCRAQRARQRPDRRIRCDDGRAFQYIPILVPTRCCRTMSVQRTARKTAPC